MSTPGFPLPLRNALAVLAIDALGDDAALAALAWVADQSVAPSPAAAARLATVHLIDPGQRTLLSVHAPYAAGAAAHAERALAACTVYRRCDVPPEPTTRAALQAMALWGAGLFFEVHEVLEAVWKDATGEARQALQGVIQIAVAFHHLAHGNPRGARSLMHEGRERLTSVGDHALPAVDRTALLAATAAWEQGLTAGTPPDRPPPPLPMRLDG